MSAGKYDMVVEKGTDFSVPLHVLDGERKPRDLSGFTARMQVRPFPDCKKIIDSLTTENGRIEFGAESETNSAKSRIVLLWPSTVTETLETGCHYYDLELVSSDGKVERLLEGRCRIVQEVTR